MGWARESPGGIMNRSGARRAERSPEWREQTRSVSVRLPLSLYNVIVSRWPGATVSTVIRLALRKYLAEAPGKRGKR